MNTKLTLRIDEELIKVAKKHAAVTGKSVSRMVADYFILLDKMTSADSIQLTPIVRSLKGSLKCTQIDESEYKKYIEEKHA